MVIQWVTRTTAECRGRTDVADTPESEIGPQTESAICEIVPLASGLCTRSRPPLPAAAVPHPVIASPR